MPLEFIPARVGQLRSPATEHLIQQIRSHSTSLGLEDGVMYYGWPKFTDYDAIRHYVDVAVISPTIGVVFIRVLPSATVKQVTEAAESVSQASATAISQLVRSPALRTRSRHLKVNVI